VELGVRGGISSGGAAIAWRAVWDSGGGRVGVTREKKNVPEECQKQCI